MLGARILKPARQSNVAVYTLLAKTVDLHLLLVRQAAHAAQWPAPSLPPTPYCVVRQVELLEAHLLGQAQGEGLGARRADLARLQVQGLQAGGGAGGFRGCATQCDTFGSAMLHSSTPGAWTGPAAIQSIPSPHPECMRHDSSIYQAAHDSSIYQAAHDSSIYQAAHDSSIYQAAHDA